MINIKFIASLAIPILLITYSVIKAEDGYRLWIRYDRLPQQTIESYKPKVTALSMPGTSATLNAAHKEVLDGVNGLLGTSLPVSNKVDRNGMIIVGTPKNSSIIAGLKWDKQLTQSGAEAFRIRSMKINYFQVIVIASNEDIGVLYGVFHFLRLLQTLHQIDKLDIDEKPRLQIRTLNHWDNLDGSIERGYAGKSLWNWNDLPEKIDPRLQDYARANASIGINGSVLNNVNSNSLSLSEEYLRKTAAIANVFRPYGIRVYLSARFSAPIELGKLKTADPFDPAVIEWWKNKADEIYRLIPDFGGFLVKANSEGQPGPRTYNRNHVDGANMLAAALSPHNGIVMWRAFVYDMKPGYDRAGAAYENLSSFDGKFAPNVLLQVKNGPIDFQPREPFHPLFGAMPNTQVMPELQITQEYLGFGNHLVFLAMMWREFLDSDTYAKGRGSTVTRVIDGNLHNQRLTGIAGVSNTGSARNWTGHHFAQSNWYAFGRLAWNPYLSAKQIADEWIKMTLTHESNAVNSINRMMIESHEACVDYMTPLGLHHIMWPGHHYGPAPWWDKEEREDWNSVYYHRADEQGLGFDRTATGSNTISQYHQPVANIYSDIKRCPEKYLMWFHHVKWDHKLQSGNTLWDEMALRYQRGVNWTRETRSKWSKMKNVVDNERFTEISKKLEIQERDAIWWKDATLCYFQTFSKRPLPIGVEKPQKTLNEYKEKSLSWE